MIEIQPNEGELPSSFADRLGLMYASKVSAEDKKTKGQFFTPLEVARYMAGFSKTTKRKVRILDPGCGVGILSCALTEHLQNNTPVSEIELTVFETDISLIPYAEKVYAYLRDWLAEKNVVFNHFLCANDFILHNSSILANIPDPEDQFDIVIANPPYFKISKNDPRVEAAKAIIYGQTNIYSIFMIVSAKLLQSGGQLIFITPRSFSSGSYFRLFRDIFFSITLIKHIHLFHSRRSTFKRDKILLENVIISACKRMTIQKEQQLNLAFLDEAETVNISVSNGVGDIGQQKGKTYRISELLNFSSDQKILHIPTSTIDENAIRIFKTWQGSLSIYGLDVSTGPVVDFRSLQFICNKKLKNAVPLIWLHNVRPMQVEWPGCGNVKGKAKGHYILTHKDSLSRLVENKNLVLLRRFSSKEDKSKLVAAPFLQTQFPNYSKIGIENHLNYIYNKSSVEFDINLVYGLSALLNSKVFDIYFRTFNGNINVSATELRDLPLPTFEKITEIGEIVQRENPSIDRINEIIGITLNIDLNYDDADSCP